MVDTLINVLFAITMVVGLPFIFVMIYAKKHDGKFSFETKFLKFSLKITD